MMRLLPFSEKGWQFLSWVNSTLTTTGCLVTAAFLFCLLAILKTMRNYKMAMEAGRLMEIPHHPDMSAVAGEDVITAQMDLARAYIEMGNKTQAATILSRIGGSGTESQQREAERLLSETR